MAKTKQKIIEDKATLKCGKCGNEYDAEKLKEMKAKNKCPGCGGKLEHKKG